MIKLRDYQREAVNSVYEYWAKEKGNPLIIAPPCGAGKSLIIGEIVRRYAVRGNARAWFWHTEKNCWSKTRPNLRNLWSDAPTGFYSAGIGRRDRGAQILFAGIPDDSQQNTPA